MKPKNNKITLMYIPHNSNGKVVTLKFSKYTLLFIVTLIFIALSTFFITMYVSSKYSSLMINYSQAIIQNRTHVHELNKLEDESKKMKLAIIELKERDQEIRSLLGFDPNYHYFSIETKNKRNRPRTYVERNIFLKVKSYVIDHFSEIQSDIDSQKKSQTALIFGIKSLIKNFQFIPSIWPVAGGVGSGFGFRTNPLSGNTQFHKGLDISSWEGAPVRSAATGVVTFAGWEGGYGNLIVVNHQNGFITKYGHNSKLIAHYGERVRKGQVIAYVGSTGLSTGPHSHYEVIRNGAIVSPGTYLNLSIFNVNKKI